MAYPPIEDHGLIGNMHTAALVGIDGCIRWMCWPHFDSPSLFAALLDDEQGGFFQIAPLDGQMTQRQLYWPETNVLITRFLSEDGVTEVIDYMPVGLEADAVGYHHLVRRVQVIRGQMQLRMVCRPAFDYARADYETQVTGEGARFSGDDLCMDLMASVPLVSDGDGDGDGVTATFTLRQGERAHFTLHEVPHDSASGHPLSVDEEEALLNDTVDYWHQWLRRCTYTGRWRAQVHRSALTLKLLTFAPTGAIVAAPTCSLPERIGGHRNWDYRYTWMRDAAFTLYGLLRIGFTQEAAAFMGWLSARCHEREDGGALQIVYALDGRHDLTEQTLDHLEGYRGSSPVRIGNGAHDQLQLDIYGELMDAVYLYNKYGTEISYDFWVELRQLLDWVCDNWQRKDEGIWETRGERQHFVYSKLMCWVALDRGIRLARKRSFPAPHQHWLEQRDAIYQEIMSKGWNEDIQAFVQHYDTDALDASNLIMPLVFFMAPTDPRMLKTLEAIARPPEAGGLLSDSLVYRYNPDRAPDGLEGDEGTFNMCTFWLVEALTRAGRTDPEKLAQARLMFEKMMGYANHLGLYGEETGACGEALGNFPQAFTHLALISAAYNLDRALSGKA